MAKKDTTVREFHLFAGIGGGIYGGELLGHHCVGGVEINDFCKNVLRQRQEDKWMDEFPIFDDVTKLCGAEFVDKFDILCGGFPCQAFSHAAHGNNIPEKNLWGEMRRFAIESEAPVVFAENVTVKAIDKAKSDLEELGYKVERCRVSCENVGADHRRNRFWLMAVRDNDRFIDIAEKIITQPKTMANCWTLSPIEIQYPANDELIRKSQLCAIGNAQSPIAAAVAFRVLVMRHLLGKYHAEEASQKEIDNVFERKTTWIKENYGMKVTLHTPTTMANYHCESMQKHISCRYYSHIFGRPMPKDAEYLMGFPIGASSPNPMPIENFEIWNK